MQTPEPASVPNDPDLALVRDLIAALTRAAAAQEQANAVQAKSTEAMLLLARAIEGQNRVVGKLATSVQAQANTGDRLAAAVFALLDLLPGDEGDDGQDSGDGEKEGQRYLSGAPVNGRAT